MAKIAYILLCHKDPASVIRQAKRLTAVGDYMAIHFDGSSDARQFRQIKRALKDNPNVVFPDKRLRCGWGEWSLVQATLNTSRAALEAFPDATHFYLLSGDCMAIKSAEHAHRFLDHHDRDFIESVDYFESNWIKTGWKEERLIYRHFVNERTQKRLFYAMFRLQRRLGIKREIPADLQIMIGSQWWCLRRGRLRAHQCNSICRILSHFKGFMPFITFPCCASVSIFAHLITHGLLTKWPPSSGMERNGAR